jgi:type I restriction enzyme R subunit
MQTVNESSLEDYLAAFGRFVKENPANIEAIPILLEWPQRWGKHALLELREKLKAPPGGFTDENLQEAYRLRFNKFPVDLISMIKHAADEQAPLYTAEERVTNAFTVLANEPFSEEQIKWLEKIREHLIANLAIDIEDFEHTPSLAQFGGWGRANHKFGHRLNEILRDLNKAIAT